MKALFAAISVFILCLTPPALAEDPKSTDWLAFDDQQYLINWYESVLSLFTEYRDVFGEDHKRIAVVISPTFSDIVFVGIELRPAGVRQLEQMTVNLKPAIELRAGFYGSSSTVLRNDLSGLLDRTTKQKFTLQISDESFTETFSQILGLFADESNFPSEFHGCTDGVQVFIEIADGQNNKFFTRHDCDEDAREVFDRLKPLFAFALETIPEADADLRKAWAQISAEDLLGPRNAQRDVE